MSVSAQLHPCGSAAEREKGEQRSARPLKGFRPTLPHTPDLRPGLKSRAPTSGDLYNYNNMVLQRGKYTLAILRQIVNKLMNCGLFLVSDYEL